LTGCFDDGDCTTTTTDLVQIGFRNYESLEAEAVAINSITLTGTDAVFYATQEEALDAIALPLDPSATSVTINFDLALETHELTIDYHAVPRLISPDCGVEVTFKNISTDDEKHDFDSVAVRSSTLDEVITTNIVIYQ
jgi:hypothetical protein